MRVFLYDIIMVSVVCLLLAYGLTMALTAESMEGEAAMILKYRWAKFRNLPRFNIDQDPIRRNLRHGVSPTPPPSCHFYLIDKSCRTGPIERSVVCVECSRPSHCQGKNSDHFSLVLQQGRRGHWTPIGHQTICRCDLVNGNYIFI